MIQVAALAHGIARGNDGRCGWRVRIIRVCSHAIHVLDTRPPPPKNINIMMCGAIHDALWCCWFLDATVWAIGVRSAWRDMRVVCAPCHGSRVHGHERHELLASSIS